MDFLLFALNVSDVDKDQTLTPLLFADDPLLSTPRSVTTGPRGVCYRIVTIVATFRWCYVECVLHHERDVREEQ